MAETELLFSGRSRLNWTQRSMVWWPMDVVSYVLQDPSDVLGPCSGWCPA